MLIRLPHEFVPRYYQQRYFDFYDQGGRNGVWVWHRRAGKDLTALHQTAKQAMECPAVYWHCLPTYAQARKAVWNSFQNTNGKRLLRSVFPKEIVKHPKEFMLQAEMVIELINGALIQLVGSDSIDNIVGAGPKHVTFSEYALCKPNSYNLVRPMLRESGGTASFIFTPRGNNHAKDIYEVAAKTPGWTRDLKSIHDTGAWREWRNDATNAPFTTAQEVLDAELLAGMQPELVRQEYECDFTAALVGSVYGDLLERMEKTGRLCEFPHDGKEAMVAYDLGMNDSTAIWIWEIHDGGADLIAFYENHGKPLSHYFDWLDEQAAHLHLTYRMHWLPHDAKAKTLASTISIQDQFNARFGANRVNVGPKLAILDGLQAGRWLFQQNTRIHPRCGMGIEALKQYHYEWDEERRTFTNRPEHDWSSHPADAYRCLALVARHSGLMLKAKPAEKPPATLILLPSYPFTMNDLMQDHQRSLRARRRIP
jgi:hypothetical protein